MTETTIRVAMTSADWASAAVLFREYVAGLPFVLDFQDVDVELSDLEAEYGAEDGVVLIAALDGDDVGAVGLHRFSGGDGEMKRMYVREVARGHGIGRALAEAIIASARKIGFRRVVLDTVRSLDAANQLYESLGFVDIEAYRHNPRPDARYLGLDLGVGDATG